MQINTISSTLEKNSKQLEEFKGSEEERMELELKMAQEEDILFQKLAVALAENNENKIELENSQKNEIKQPHDQNKGIWQHKNKDGGFQGN